MTVRDFCFDVMDNTKIVLHKADPSGVYNCIFENIDPMVLRESTYRDWDIDRIEALRKNRIALYI